MIRLILMAWAEQSTGRCLPADYFLRADAGRRSLPAASRARFTKRGQFTNGPRIVNANVTNQQDDVAGRAWEGVDRSAPGRIETHS